MIFDMDIVIFQPRQLAASLFVSFVSSPIAKTVELKQTFHG